MKYEAAYTMIRDQEPGFLSCLTEEQLEELKCVDDFESICYIVTKDGVTIADGLNGDILSYQTMEEFLRETLAYLEEE